MWPFRRPFDDRCLKAAAGERSSSLRADVCAPRRIVASISVFRQASGTNLAKVENSQAPPRGMSRTGLRLACLTHTRCPAPCTRAHACTARSTRTLHACEPRQRRAHALTQQHALTRQKHHVVPRVTGHWLTVGRPAAEPSSAQSQRKCTRHISLLVSHVHHPHAVHATHHHCRTQRHDDNDRDENERHDEEDREHDGRCERVRVRSHLPLSRPKAHAHARCQAPLTLSAKQEPFQHPDGHGTISLLTPAMSPQLAGPIERSVDLRQRGS